jgi:hypothetical protein
MSRRRKALESSLELLEDQYFKAQDVMDGYHRLAQTVRDQLVTGECLSLLDDLGEGIQAWACYSDFSYRHPEEWPTYVDEREKAALERLLRGTP